MSHESSTGRPRRRVVHSLRPYAAGAGVLAGIVVAMSEDTVHRVAPATGGADPSSGLPLLVTASVALREEVLRLAAAAGVAPVVVERPEAALAGWATAPLVLVGEDRAEAMAGLVPGRRDGVHVVGWGPVEPTMFRVAVDLGAEQVAELPRSEAWLVEALTDVGESARVRGRVIGVVGGSGGAGATTLACALGQSAGHGGAAVVIDCDSSGPGVDRVLGLDVVEGIRWEALCRTTGRLSSRALREALPRRATPARGRAREPGGSVGALTWQAGSVATLQAFAVREAFSAARRGHDTVVLDLPRSGDPVVAELAARCDQLLVVVAPSLTGVAAAARTCARWAEQVAPGLVVRGAGADVRDVERAVRAPVLAVMADQRGLEESIDLGLGPVRSARGPLARVCAELLPAAGRRGVAA